MLNPRETTDVRIFRTPNAMDLDRRRTHNDRSGAVLRAVDGLLHRLRPRPQPPENFGVVGPPSSASRTADAGARRVTGSSRLRAGGCRDEGSSSSVHHHEVTRLRAPDRGRLPWASRFA